MLAKKSSEEKEYENFSKRFDSMISQDPMDDFRDK
jgi:hypothetical protein|tara:strand:- start:227 stop:331 length:105 start_codon:yes stop_codon:yes gene_type:complete